MNRLLAASALFLSFSGFSQSGILPFSGLTYSFHGLSAEELVVELNEATWTSNRLPVDTEFEIRMIRPQGFTAVDGMFYPGIEVTMLNPAGDTLGYIANMLDSDEFTGYEDNTLKKLSVDLAFNELSKPGDLLIIHARFFDTNSDNYLETAMNVEIVDSELPLENTFSTSSVSSTAGYSGIATGMEFNNVKAFQTVTKNRKDKWDNYHIHADSLVGVTPEEWTKGTLICSYYTNDLKEIELPSDKITATARALPGENNSMNAAVAVALFKDPDMKYIRVRWENDDRSKVLDIVSER